MEDEEKEPSPGTVPAPSIPLTLEAYKELHTAYVECTSRPECTRDSVLVYDGAKLLIGYLYYLLQYMEWSSPDIMIYAGKNGTAKQRRRL